MEIYELNIKVYLLKDIAIDRIQQYITYFIDNTLIKEDEFAKKHAVNDYKYYTFDSLYPLAKQGIYHKNKIYTFRLRTIDSRLADYFYNNLAKNRTDELQGLTIMIKILKNKLIKKIYTLTPAVLKTTQGYWKNSLNLEEFEERLKVNLIKKYNQIYNCKMNENFQLYYQINFKNKVPVSRKYKDIKLLGDMIELEIAENENAQKLAWLAIGTGLLEMNARGFGFVNYILY